MKNVSFLLLAVVLLSGCGYNTIQKQDEEVNSAHAQILSVYQKRFDLVPNLVQVVKGYAEHEKAIFIEVAEARASVGKVELPKDATPEQAQLFMDSQKHFSSALSRLLVVAENYPQLKADAGFRDLQRQLEEIESQATAARNKYIRSISTFNFTVRAFPVNLTAKLFGYSPKPQLQFENEQDIKRSPQVKF